MWSSLPPDLTVYVLELRALCIRRERSAQAVQCHWLGYRTRVLLGRYRLLQYLRVFREYNSDASEFMRRARL